MTHESTKPVPGFSVASFETSFACLKSVNGFQTGTHVEPVAPPKAEMV